MPGFILDEDTTNTVELHSMPEGEYQLRFLKGEQKMSKKTNKPMVQLNFDIVGEVEAKDLTHYIMLPTSDMDAKERNRRQLSIRDLKYAFGLSDNDRIDFDSLIGETVWAILAEEENEEYGKQNRIRRFLAKR